MKDDKRIDDLLSTANQLGGKKNLMSDVVGMPDNEDKANIQLIIDNYEKEFPGQIEDTITLARSFAKGEFNTVDKNSNRRYILELPPMLVGRLEEYIPTIFKDKRHFAWFCKNFKKLTITGKY